MLEPIVVNASLPGGGPLLQTSIRPPNGRTLPLFQCEKASSGADFGRDFTANDKTSPRRSGLIGLCKLVGCAVGVLTKEATRFLSEVCTALIAVATLPFADAAVDVD
jgi:hypothetical protein